MKQYLLLCAAIFGLFLAASEGAKGVNIFGCVIMLISGMALASNEEGGKDGE